MTTTMNKSVALIAHDGKKDKLVEFTQKHARIFERFPLIATGTTGGIIQKTADLDVERVNSGPLGGDQQIGAMISQGSVLAVFFFRDPLTSQPHEADVNALMRICDVYDTPLATNTGAAEAMIHWLETQTIREQIRLVEPIAAFR